MGKAMEQTDLMDTTAGLLVGWLPQDQLDQLQDIVVAACAEGYDCDLRTLMLARFLTPEKPASA
jgi:hypothetical protein